MRTPRHTAAIGAELDGIAYEDRQERRRVRRQVWRASVQARSGPWVPRLTEAELHLEFRDLVALALDALGQFGADRWLAA